MPNIISVGSGSMRALGFGARPTGFNGFNAPALMNGSTSLYAMYNVVWSPTLNRFVATGYDGNNYLVYANSTTGASWPTPTTVGAFNINIGGLAVNSSGLMVSVGFLSTYYPFAYYSTNGTSWTYASISSSVKTYVVPVICNSSGTFYAFGQLNGNSTGQYYTSTNGSTWSAAQTVGTATTFTPKSAALGSGTNLCLVGTNASSYPVYSYSSDNGTTWTTPTTLNSTATNLTTRCLAANPAGQMVWIGFSGTNIPWFSYSSNNGVSWTAAANLSATKYIFTSVIWDSVLSLWVAVGWYAVATPYYAVYTTSPDGVTWSTITAMGGVTTTTYFIESTAISPAGTIAGVGINSTSLYWPAFTSSK